MTDKELAILVKFKIGEYLKPTQQEILDYSIKRGLTGDRITQLTSDYNSSNTKSQIGSLQKLKRYIQEVISGVLERL